MRVVPFTNHKHHFKVPTGFGSWLEYWEHCTGRKADGCKNIDCTKRVTLDDLVGGHVDIPGVDGVFLIPLCKECNHYTNRSVMHGWDYDFVKVPKALLIPEV